LTGIKVLIVEDQSFVALGMQAVLTMHGYCVTAIAASGEAAITSVRVNRSDVVLMDIILNGDMNGIEAAQAIKQEHAGVHLIFITSLQDAATFRKAKMVFPEHYITKPYTEIQLLAAIELTIQNTALRPAAQEADLTESSIFIPDGNKKKVRLLNKDILYIKAGGEAYSEANGGGSYVAVYYEYMHDGKVHTGKYEASVSAGKMVKQLAYPGLAQVHRSYHVNVDKIDTITIGYLLVKGYKVPIGPSFRSIVQARVRSLRFGGTADSENK
jgi:DNA-binding LytR/AlgR family response regulator